jgi:ectoine hydroxylase-related dioxygenase (phytanoyl-CoA dioxygenase family)
MDQTPLKTLWEHSRRQISASSTEWGSQLQAIYACGKGLEETLQYLHYERPTLEAFLNWMNSNSSSSMQAVTGGDVLSADDLADFEKQGCLVFRRAVDSAACAEARAAIQAHLNVHIDDPASWYNAQADCEGLMVQLYHHPVLDSNRRSPRIRRAFEQLYASTAIHAVVDKVSFNPPVTPFYTFKGSPLHWDVSLAQPIPLKLQGLLYLSDCTADGGAFHCVPGFHKEIGNWLESLPGGANPREEAIRLLQPLAIPGQAGDLVIWHQALPHCATANRSSHPRFVQYITYDPDGYCEQEVWI